MTSSTTATNGVTRVDARALTELVNDLADAYGAVTEAFADYDWLTKRALRDFRSRIRRPACLTPALGGEP